MSSPFALAGVTAVLKYILGGNLSRLPVPTGGLSSVTPITALSPEQAEQATATTHLNLFLHQISPNAAWRNQDLASRDSAGNRITNQTLALDLHYFVTAYGVADLDAEVLLGYAVDVLHEVPVLSRDIVRQALAKLTVGTDSFAAGIQASSLSDQIEQLKISPFPLNTEEMSRFWQAMQAHYRPTFSFQVTVVLIQAQNPASSPLPVLTVNIGPQNTGVQTGLTPPAPVLAEVVPPSDPNSAQIGQTVILQGTGLTSSATPLVVLTNDKFEIQNPPFAVSGTPTDTQTQFLLPELPAGAYLVSLQLKDPVTSNLVVTNSLPFLIAPKITAPTLPATVSGSGGTATINITCDPAIRQEQSVALVLGGLVVAAQPIPFTNPPTTTNNVTFIVDTSTMTLPATFLARLRVDGIDSFILNQAATPPVYLNNTITITP